MRVLSTIAVALLVIAAAPAQSGVPDQHSPFATASFHLANPANTWQIQVRAGTSGLLEGFTVHLRADTWALLRLRVREGDGWNTSPAPWIAYFTVPPTGGTWQPFYFDCSSGGVSLAAHETFVIELTGGPSQSNLAARGDFVAPPGVPPYPEPLFLNGLTHDGWRIGFQTWMLPPGPTLAVSGPCPGPASVLFSGLTPGGIAAVGGSLALGPSVITGGGCAGTVMGLVGPTLLALVTADAAGNAGFPIVLPAIACGIYNLQGLDLSTCYPTNIVLL